MRLCPPSGSLRTSNPPVTSPRRSRQLDRRARARADRFQTLLGITGSGKTATIAWTIEQVQRPTLVLAPNKSLAAQLAGEFRDSFRTTASSTSSRTTTTTSPRRTSRRPTPTSRRTPRSTTRSTGCGTRRRKSCSPAATSSSSPRCRASTGSARPRSTRAVLSSSSAGESHDQRALLRRLVDMHYDRNDIEPRARERSASAATRSRSTPPTRRRPSGSSSSATRSSDRAVRPAHRRAHRRARRARRLPGLALRRRRRAMRRAIASIEAELARAAARVRERRASCSRRSGSRCAPSTTSRCSPRSATAAASRTTAPPRRPRAPGQPPYTLLDYFPDDWLFVIDECHVRCPSSTASTPATAPARSPRRARLPPPLGARQPAAAFEEFEDARQPVRLRVGDARRPTSCGSRRIVEQIVRPTGLVDPEVASSPRSARSTT